MTFYYNQQLKFYMIQFMAIFSGLQVKVGKTETEEERLISIPIYWGNRDRVVAHILGDNTQNKLLRVPAMSVSPPTIDLAPDRRHGVNVTRRKTYLPEGGLIPDDIKTVRQFMTRPYWINIELRIYASNTDQHNQILEPILTLFDPTLDIEKSDGVFDWARITAVELTGINNNNNYPSLADNRVIQTGLTFKFIAELGIPAEVRSEFVNEIKVRIGKIDAALSTKTPQEIVEILNEEGINYDLFASGNDLKFK